MRVVSLLPSATETLCLIGGQSMLVGRSHECDHPPTLSDIPVLTDQRIDRTGAPSPDHIDREVTRALSSGASLYRLDSRKLQQLAPDLILTQDLCEVCSIDLESVRRAACEIDPEPRIISLDPHTFEDVLDDVMTIGAAVGLERQAADALVALRQRFFRASDFVNAYAQRPRVALLEWCDPLFVGGHWTPQLIERAGADHPLNPTAPMEGAGAGAGAQMAHRIAGKSIRAAPDDLERADLDAIIVCPCGVSLHEIPAHLASIEREPWWRSLRAVREGRIALVDGTQMFSRPGPRLVDAYQWLVGWLNDRPELMPEEFPWAPYEQ